MLSPLTRGFLLQSAVVVGFPFYFFLLVLCWMDDLCSHLSVPHNNNCVTGRCDLSLDAVLVEILIILLRRQRGIWRPVISLADHRQTVLVSPCPSEHLAGVLQLPSWYGIVSLWQLYIKCQPGIEAQDKADHLSEKWTTSRGRVINLLAIYKTSSGRRNHFNYLSNCGTREECLTGINWGMDECGICCWWSLRQVLQWIFWWITGFL